MSIIILLIAGFLSANATSGVKCEKEINKFIKQTRFGTWNPPLSEARWVEYSYPDKAKKQVEVNISQRDKTHKELVNTRIELDDLWKKEKNVAISNLGLNKEYSDVVVALAEAKKQYNQCQKNKSCMLKTIENFAYNECKQDKSCTDRTLKIIFVAPYNNFDDNVEFRYDLLKTNHIVDIITDSKKDLNAPPKSVGYGKKAIHPKEAKIFNTYVDLEVKERLLREKLLLKAKNSKFFQLYKKEKDLSEKLQKIDSEQKALYKLVKINSNQNKENQLDLFERATYLKIIEADGVEVYYDESISEKGKPKAQITINKYLPKYSFLKFNIGKNCEIIPVSSVEDCHDDSLVFGLKDGYLCDLTNKANKQDRAPAPSHREL